VQARGRSRKPAESIGCRDANGDVIGITTPRRGRTFRNSSYKFAVGREGDSAR
jgi:hypothetical protein